MRTIFISERQKICWISLQNQDINKLEFTRVTITFRVILDYIKENRVGILNPKNKEFHIYSKNSSPSRIECKIKPFYGTVVIMKLIQGRSMNTTLVYILYYCQHYSKLMIVVAMLASYFIQVLPKVMCSASLKHLVIMESSERPA